MKKMKTRTIFMIFVALFLIIGPAVNRASSASTDFGLTTTKNIGSLTAAFGQSSLLVMIGKITAPLLSLVGVLFLILIICSGILWMTAAGSESQIGKSKKTLAWSVIGLIVVFSSSALTSFIGKQATGNYLDDRYEVSKKSQGQEKKVPPPPPEMTPEQKEYVIECASKGEMMPNPNYDIDAAYIEWRNQVAHAGDSYMWMSDYFYYDEPKEIFVPYGEEICKCLSGYYNYSLETLMNCQKIVREFDEMVGLRPKEEDREETRE